MTTSFTSDDFTNLIKFPFQDTDWKNKLLVGSLVVLAGYALILPLVLVYGYCYQIMRGIIVDKREPFMPVWDDWGKLFVDGLKLIGVYLIYSLPLLLFFCGGYFLLLATMVGTGAIAETSPDEPMLAILPMFGAFGWLACFGLGMIFALALGLVMPAALSHVVATDDFGAGFRFGEWWAIFKANWAGFIMAFVIVMAIYFGLTILMQILYFTIIGCCFIPFLLIFVTFYLLLISSVMFAQAYRDGVQKLGMQPSI